MKLAEVLESFEFRTVKGRVQNVDDLNNAVRKGMKIGMGKTENEIEWVGIELSKVLKLRRKSK